MGILSSRSTRQMLAYKRASCLQGLGGAVQLPRVDLENVPEPVIDFQACIDTVTAGRVRQAPGIVQQDFLAAHLYQQRRKAGKVAKYG